MKKLKTLNHLLEDILSKEYTLVKEGFWQNNSYCRIIFPEADPRTLQNIRWSTLQQDLSSILDMAGVLNHIWLLKQMEIEIIKLWLITIILLPDSEQTYPEGQDKSAKNWQFWDANLLFQIVFTS